MKKFVRNVISFYRRERFGKFLVRIFTWIPEYIHSLGIELYRFCWNHSYSFRGWIRYKALKSERNVDSYVRFKNVTTGLEYCQKNDLRYEILNPNEKVQVVSSEVFWERTEAKSVELDAPPIYLAVLPEMEVYGATDILSKGNEVLFDIFKRDKTHRRYMVEYGSVIWSGSGADAHIGIAYKGTDVVIEKAIHCLGISCEFYWHFTFEILPRLVLADRYEEFRSLPVLLDADALKIPQMKELVDRVNIYQHPIISIEKCDRVHVRNLVYISPVSWVLHRLKFGFRPIEEDFMISYFAVNHIRDRVLTAQKDLDRPVYKKIYLSRRECNRTRLSNQEEIEQIFTDYGYHIVSMEKLSFDEQVHLIYNADNIVAVAGGAVTNILYCHEGASVGVLTFNIETPYLFSNIANIVKVNYMTLRGDLVAGKGETFVMEAEKCRAYAELMERQSKE